MGSLQRACAIEGPSAAFDVRSLLLEALQLGHAQPKVVEAACRLHERRALDGAEQVHICTLDWCLDALPRRQHVLRKYL